MKQLLMPTLAVALLSALQLAKAQSASPLDVICNQTDLSTFCRLARLAKDEAQDPVAIKLNNRTQVLTVFPPMDRGINNTRVLLNRFMGMNITELLADPAAAARFVKSHVVLGVASDTRGWRRGSTTFMNTLSSPLSVLEGLRMNLFIRGPLNTAKVMRRNVVAGRGLLQVVEWPLYPSPA